VGFQEIEKLWAENVFRRKKLMAFSGYSPQQSLV
jgi:hypothetical protein